MHANLTKLSIFTGLFGENYFREIFKFFLGGGGKRGGGDAKHFRRKIDA